MNNWVDTILSQVSEVKLCNVDKKTNKDEIEVRLCNYMDVYKNPFINANKAKYFMIATCNRSELDNFKIQEGQVAITKDSEKRDDIGISTYMAESFDDVVLGYHTALITPEKGSLCGKFLNYWFNTKFAKVYFENNAGGSGQRCTLPIDIIKSIPLKLPPIKLQEKIASIFFNIDAKIELNNKINAELEAMAKLIYDYWFVQFEFPFDFAQDKPKADIRPYKSSGGKMVWNEELKREVPEGWEVKELGEMIQIFDSQRIPISSRDRLNRKGIIPYYGATSIMDYIDDFIFDDEYILMAEDGSVMNEKGLPIVQFIWGKTWVNNHAHVIQAKNKSNNEFYFQQIKMIPVVLIKTGSIQMKINQENLKKYRVLTPPEHLISKYSLTANSYRKELINKIEENQKLVELRDWLLPMLMNGQVRVN